MSDILNSENCTEQAFEKTMIDEEEFFERELFQDVLELKSLRKVAENAAIDVNKLQDQAYQTLFSLYQQNRGIKAASPGQDDIFPIFELFFKSYYQYFRQAMEGLLATESPVKVAYFLGKNSDKVTAMFDQFIKDLQHEVA
ncbi:MAG TPA: hypothetical protein DDW50_00825 [Firmicutes bacterium]|jgi:hypothetical protein|nr:hypothetical protein [Bacillota bacterium]